MNKETKAVSPTAFFVLTFILSWSIWISLILASSQFSEGLSNIVRLFGVLMPAVAAVSLTAYAAGRTGIKQLLSRLKIWKVGGTWWLSGLLVYPVLLVAAGLLYNLFDAQNSITVLPFSVSVLIANVIFLTIAALGEEIGWRGVALPTLQKKYTPVLSSLALGLLSAVWHLPFWLLIGTLSQFGWTYFVMNFLFIVPTTFFITWIFNNTKSSLLLPVAFHLAFNVVNVAIFPVTNSVGAFGVFIVLQFVVMLMTIPSLMKKSIFTKTK